MKILKCHIENFGKLSNFDYQFENGINNIKQENGFGKTTFASFIKAMFYGMEAKRNTKALIDRKKYQPWQGGAFGGSIEFEINGKQYKIERFFAKKEADDTFKLYDLSTNLESNDYTQNIGEEIFKLNKEAYERSTFISGQNIETSINDSISAKLGNVLESENDINTSEKAIKLLDDTMKNYIKTGGKGQINEKKAEKTILEQKLEQSKIAEKSLQERKKKNNELDKVLKEKEQEQQTVKKLIDLKRQEEAKEEAKKAKLENYKMLQNNLEESRKVYEGYKKNINEDSELKEKIIINETKLKNIEETLKKLKKDINKVKKVNNILLAVAIIIILIGIVLIVKNINAVSIITIVAGVITLGVYLIKINNLKKSKQSFLNKNQEQQNIENVIETFKDLYKKEIETRNNELEKLKFDYQQKQKAKEDFERLNNIEELRNQRSFEKIDINIEQKVRNLEQEIRRLNDEKNYNKNQIELLESNLDTVFDIENEIEDLNQKIYEMQESYGILEKTKKYLETAKEQFSSHYLGKMENSFVKNLELINGQKLDINLDVNLNVQINEQGSNKQIDFFSTGYKDLMYICMRLSLIDSLFEEEKPFIILDDPFVNLDEYRINNAIDLLNKISKDYQVIYFTCHESRVATTS